MDRYLHIQINSVPSADIPFNTKRLSSSSHLLEYSPCFCLSTLDEEKEVVDVVFIGKNTLLLNDVFLPLGQL